MAAAAAILRPSLRHHLAPSFPAPPQQLQPSPVSLQVNQQPSGRRRWVPKASFSGKEMVKTTEDIKTELYLALQGIDRGIFGLTSGKKVEIEDMVEQLEFRNPTPNPTDYLMSKVDGCWKLVYTTVTILGSKRTKLGLRGFICVGDVYQTIDAAQEGAVNVIHFTAKGLRLLSGRLTIRASYMIASKSRVDIKLEASSIAPEQFASLFEKNYDLLIAIFNPEGWLDITYVDESMRIGRDDKGNIFVLERTIENAI